VQVARANKIELKIIYLSIKIFINEFCKTFDFYVVNAIKKLFYFCTYLQDGARRVQDAVQSLPIPLAESWDINSPVSYQLGSES
jgi:hypothetical protein